MKSIKALTRSEIASLSNEQLDLYLQKELMDNGCPIDIFDKKDKKSIEYPKPVGNIYIIEASYYASLGFSSLKDAEDFVKATGKGIVMGYDYITTEEGSNSYHYKENSKLTPSIKSVQVYSKSDLNDFRKRIDVKKEVDERINKAEDVKDDFWSFVHKRVDEYNFNISLLPVMERYMKILDGDKDKAVEIMKDSYIFNEETEMFLKNDGKIKLEENKD